MADEPESREPEPESEEDEEPEEPFTREDYLRDLRKVAQPDETAG